MVLKNPPGYPDMAEVGNMPLPAKLLKQGVSDMVRISDAHMSGTAILHVAPEAAAAGKLAPVRDGDIIEVDVAARRLELMVSEEELAIRRGQWPPPSLPEGGYQSLCVERVLQADGSCDFDFLVGRRDASIPRHSH